jgi:hypothetical protein
MLAPAGPLLMSSPTARCNVRSIVGIWFAPNVPLLVWHTLTRVRVGAVDGPFGFCPAFMLGLPLLLAAWRTAVAPSKDFAGDRRLLCPPNLGPSRVRLIFCGHWVLLAGALCPGPNVVAGRFRCPRHGVVLRPLVAADTGAVLPG